MPWVERHFKDLVPIPLPWTGMSATGSIYRCILYCSRAMARFYFNLLWLRQMHTLKMQFLFIQPCIAL